jgi:UDP-2-acetamido-3-amino-2,3-dideoxy-glucuronate N-acetyltransferase
MVGNPAKQIGWMSEHGHRLLFDDQNKATCEESGESYILDNNTVRKIKSF